MTWTDADTATLRRLWRAGAYDREIAAALGRSVWIVAHQRRQLGMPRVPYRGHPPDVRERIGAANRAKWADPAIAAGMLDGLRRGRETRNPGYLERRAKVLDLASAGLSRRQIARAVACCKANVDFVLRHHAPLNLFPSEV